MKQKNPNTSPRGRTRKLFIPPKELCKYGKPHTWDFSIDGEYFPGAVLGSREEGWKYLFDLFTADPIRYANKRALGSCSKCKQDSLHFDENTSWHALRGHFGKARTAA
jgi:hypothetical protein